MGKFLEETYQDWIPVSSFSYLVFGILSGVFFESFLSDYTLLWAFLHSIILILYSFRPIPKRKIFGMSWGVVLFFILAVGGYTKRSAPYLSESQNWKKSFSVQIEQLLQEGNIKGEAKEISLGLVLGDAKNLSSEFKHKAKEGGILHLFAASGLHLGILLGCLFSILKRIPFLGYSIPRIFPVFFGFVYLAMLGFPVSLARAWVFASWFLIQSLFFRKSRSADLLLGSAGILYLWDPSRSFGVSFLLSFGAVAAILLLLPCLENCLPKLSEEKSIWNRGILFFKENVLVSSAASLGTLPSLIYYFGSYSFGSLGLNLILVPACGILLPLLYLSLFLEFLFPVWIPKYLWILVGYLLEFLEMATSLWSELDWSLVHIYRGKTKFFALGIWFFCVLFLIVWKSLGKRKQYKNFKLDLKIDSAKTTEKKILNIIQKQIWILGLFFCLSFHILIAFSSQWIKTPPVFLGDRFSFLVVRKNTLVLAGKCKYSSKLLYKTLGKDPEYFCGIRTQDTVSEIYIEHESCLEWISRCLKRRQDTVLKYGGKQKPKIAGFENWALVPKQNEFPLPISEKTLIRFEVGKDSLFSINRNTQKGNGFILLVPRFGIPENPREWNLLRKQLGIGPGWEFIGGDELPGIPVF